MKARCVLSGLFRNVFFSNARIFKVEKTVTTNEEAREEDVKNPPKVRRSLTANETAVKQRQTDVFLDTGNLHGSA